MLKMDMYVGEDLYDAAQWMQHMSLWHGESVYTTFNGSTLVFVPAGKAKWLIVKYMGLFLAKEPVDLVMSYPPPPLSHWVRYYHWRSRVWRYHFVAWILGRA